MQVRAWLSLEPVEVEDAWEWWANRGRKSFPSLFGGARRLLLFRSGNAGLERHFSALGRILGSKGSRLRKHLHVKGVMRLRINGPALSLSGFVEEAAPETDSDGEESTGAADA